MYTQRIAYIYDTYPQFVFYTTIFIKIEMASEFCTLFDLLWLLCFITSFWKRLETSTVVELIRKLVFKMTYFATTNT